MLILDLVCKPDIFLVFVYTKPIHIQIVSFEQILSKSVWKNFWWWWWDEAAVCGCLSSHRAVRPSRGVLKGCLPRLDLVSLSGGVCVCLRARSPRLTRPSQRQWRSVVKQARGGADPICAPSLTGLLRPHFNHHRRPFHTYLTRSTLLINITGRCFASSSLHLFCMTCKQRRTPEELGLTLSFWLLNNALKTGLFLRSRQIC